MGLEDYIFALFVFGLGAILILFLVKGLSKNRSERNSIWEEREKKLERMYNETADLLDAMESYVEENKAAFDRELQQVKRYLEDMNRTTKHLEAPPKIEIETKPMTEEPAPITNKGDLKQQALILSRKGYSVGDIAQDLGVSRGEVIFMLSLTKKTI